MTAAMVFKDLKKDGFILKDFKCKNHIVKIAEAARPVNR